MAVARCLFLMCVFALQFQNAHAAAPCEAERLQARANVGEWAFGPSNNPLVGPVLLATTSTDFFEAFFRYALGTKPGYREEGIKLLNDEKALRSWLDFSQGGKLTELGICWRKVWLAEQRERTGPPDAARTRPATSPQTAASQPVPNPNQPSLSDGICKVELANMQAEWWKLRQNGPDRGQYYKTYSQFDASAVRKQIRTNAGQEPGLVARRDDSAQYRATNVWEDCLLKARSSQLSGSSTTANQNPKTDPPYKRLMEKLAEDSRRPDFREGLAAFDDALAQGRKTPPRGPPPKLKYVEEEGQDATVCLKPVPSIDGTSDTQLVNECAFEVNALWCAEGVDCKPYFSNNHNFFAKGAYPVQGTAGASRTVYYAGCRGIDSIRGSPNGFMYQCRKSPKS